MNDKYILKQDKIANRVIVLKGAFKAPSRSEKRLATVIKAMQKRHEDFQFVDQEIHHFRPSIAAPK